MIDPKVDQDQPISLRLSDVPIGIAIAYMIDHAYLDYRIDSHAYFILPHGQGELAKKKSLQTTTALNFSISIRALKVISGKVEFVEAPIITIIHLE